VGKELYPRHDVQAEITLIKDPDGIDPAFYLLTEINRPAFVEGDELEITVQASLDCYLTIINIVTENEIYILFPNKRMKENSIHKEEVYKFPSLEDKNYGISFKMEAKAGKDFHSESLLIIGTKQNIPLISLKTSDELGFGKITIQDFQEWLARIPLNQRTISTEMYTVYKSK
jgi:hypothetical protein